jgi:hypothetical protein
MAALFNRPKRFSVWEPAPGRAADKTAGQYVQKKAPNEFRRIERHNP